MGSSKRPATLLCLSNYDFEAVCRIAGPDIDFCPRNLDICQTVLISSVTIPAVCRGAVAQLGERLNGIQEVEGSIPFGSTKIRIKQILGS